ncbi:hypothetical protein L1049_008945 [Liquidambar formosana]|uniref:SWIM-type domain-containing protein n=1 Tax=Liquidambar formosana TaxID=63359 RepID=A0AAP0X2L6_LIQFO
MDAMKIINTAAYNWLMEIPVTQWSRHAFDPRVKNDSLTNNMSESFNQWVGELRFKPVLTMIDTIRCRLMSRTHKRYQTGSGWTNEITPAIMGKLDSMKQKFRTYHTMFAGGDEYEVIDGNRRHVVRLGRWDCDCRAWYISGIPCKHAIACITFQRANIASYCHDYFSKTVYLQAYGGRIHPIPAENRWPEFAHSEYDPMMLPPLRRLPGRPKINRRR